MTEFTEQVVAIRQTSFANARTFLPDDVWITIPGLHESLVKLSGNRDMARAKKYWLMKSEPDVYSIDHLAKDKNKTTCWDGVRNYQARNLMRDEMKVGDLVLFYHSNAKPPGVAGVARVVKESYPDHTQFEKKNKYFDEKATRDNPRWFMVDIQLVEKFKNFLPLDDLKAVNTLDGMVLLQKGSRLSVQPVTKKQFDTIVKLGKK